MPLDPLFADRLHLVSAPGTVFGDPGMQAFGADLSEYVGPELSIENFQIPGPQGPIPLRTYTPKSSQLSGKALLWFHGGAFAFGGLDMHEAHIVAQEMAFNTNSVVISVDYRLANYERKLPCAQIDGLAAAQWVLENCSQLGFEQNRLFIGGVSAGACIASSVALQMRDLGLAMAGLMPVYPVVHFDFQEPSPELASKVAQLPPVLTFPEPIIIRMNNFAVGEDKVVGRSHYSFPGDALDLSWLPPTLIVNCEFDSLRASGEAFTEQLTAAGVDVTQFLQLGAVHGHLNRVPADCAPMRETLVVMATFLKEH